MRARTIGRISWIVFGRGSACCDVEIGCSSVTVCLLGEIVTRLNRPLKWDPQKWQFVNDPEADELIRRPMEPWVL